MPADTKRSPRAWPLLAGWLLACAGASAQVQPTPEELQRWFEDDAEQRAAAVNEGELVFLPQPPAKRTPHSRNTLTIDAASIDSGWVGLEQCYDGLDPVAEAEVVYRYRQMRGLTVTASRHIGRAWVQGQSVQLADVGKNAELCIAAQVRVFYQNPDGSFSLVNGPYHRRFLDGYYPLHVTLDIRYPADRLAFSNFDPAPRPGLSLARQPGRLTVDAWFEGMLNTEARFRLR